MNPLSALRSAVSPELQADLLARPSSMSGPIPAADLEKLAAQPNGATATSASTGSFANYLGQMVREVNTQQGAADAAVNGLLTGQNVSLHQAMISMEEANVSFQLMVEVRNRLLDSYQELMRMQI
jgi:flagellar hook-basal body complex protein FliE